MKIEIYNRRSTARTVLGELIHRWTRRTVDTDQLSASQLAELRDAEARRLVWLTPSLQSKPEVLVENLVQQPSHKPAETPVVRLVPNSKRARAR